MGSRAGRTYRETKADSKNEDLVAEMICLRKRKDQNHQAEDRATKKISFTSAPSPMRSRSSY